MQVPLISPAAEIPKIQPAHLSHPFFPIESILNCRLVPLPGTKSPTSRPKPWLFRAGDISRITPRGTETLRMLGVHTVFDLRSDTDLPAFYNSTPTIDGIDIVQAPLLPPSGNKEYDLRKAYAEYLEDEQGAFMRSYTRVLEDGKEAIEKILRHLITRNQEDGGILFHCNGGKDRTGVLVALILAIAGQEDAVIIHDYALTTTGFQPFFSELLKKFENDAAFQENTEGAMNLFSSRPKTMENFLELIRTRYGGADAYARNVIGLSQAELETLKEKLVV